ncbi:hypothetical protein AGMMS49938_11700 [Fibrobacterales bacterium]|nr:hypothetical protein AGMMS49938_11700 [Fibrobacterales bacterium]
MPSQNRKTKFAAVVATVAVAAILVFAPSLLAKNSDPADIASVPVAEKSVFSVKTVFAEVQTLKSFIEVNGNVAGKQQVAVFPDAAGKVAQVFVALGSKVKKGDIIAQIDPSSPGSVYMNSPVYAPISGTICSTPLSVGTLVSQGEQILTIATANDLQIEAFIPEREVGRLKTGLWAEVLLPAFPNEVFTATIARVSPVLDPQSRTKEIVLYFGKNTAKVNAGMFAKVKVNVGVYPNVITVPAESVVEISGKKFVYAVSNGIANLREVNIGITIDNMAEIKSGIVAGESVVVQGQQFLSDGAMVVVAL